MVELTPLEKQQQVSDLIGDWMDENNMYLLAREGELVYWSSITGDKADYKWHRLTVPEAARIAKVMLVPPQSMPHCTSDSVYTAAQERGRAYMEGIRSHKKVLPMYFNYTEHEKEVKPLYYELYHNCIAWFYDRKLSPEWQMLKQIVNEVATNLELDVISETKANIYIREAAKDLGYKVCMGKERYYWRSPDDEKFRKWACLRYPRKVGVHVLDTETRNEIVTLIMEKHNERSRNSKVLR